MTFGLGFGSLLAGFAIQITAMANAIIFIALTIVTILGTVLIVLSPETVPRAPGALHSLVPHVSIPSAARTEFVAAAPVIAAIWMLAGLSGGLAPSMVGSVFHHDSGVLNGVAGFIGPATSAVVGLAFARVESRREMTIGIYASIVGALGIIGGLLAGSLSWMFVGLAVAGVGFGASFTAALALVVPLAAPNARAGVVAGIYLVSYLSLGIPIIIVGHLTTLLGIVNAVVWYALATVLLALISLAAQLLLQRNSRPEAAAAPTPRDPVNPRNACGDLSTWLEDEVMARPSKYPSELRERAVRAVAVSLAQGEYPSEFETIRTIAMQFGIGSPATLRRWIRHANATGGARTENMTEVVAEIRG